MDFEEWFNETFPDNDGSVVSTVIIKEIARSAWEAAFQSAQDHMRELERLAEYDRSIFGD